ncbi:alpha/beta fold hydrolase [Kineococcus rubinsiae]|uniref:alpha/beta fold hydrolase n=1 Tax=Kineococcus rubinsiae TaxID=2609562 RepID=UPI0014307D76|nr:alpha/beta fold hydrolase [Kineococcus rubinsiae]NIZ89487.1 alpha/beta fold hydrolase [Kineococcus rubinsiae]
MPDPRPPTRLTTFTREDPHAGALEFTVDDVGPLDGDVVVCLHGFPQDRRAYAAVAPLLAEAGLRVLVPDQRGYSPGARPPGRRAYAVRDLVGDVAALLDAAGAARAHVVGHDWGGAVAWALATAVPERVATLTALSTPHPAAMREGLLRGTQSLRSWYMGFFQLPRVPEALLLAGDGARLGTLLQRGGLPEDVAGAYAAALTAPGALTAALNWYRALPLAGGSGPTRPVRVPVTYLHGRRDPFFAPAAVAATGRFVAAPFRTQALDTGHWIPEARPADVAEAVLRGAGRL